MALKCNTPCKTVIYEPNHRLRDFLLSIQQPPEAAQKGLSGTWPLQIPPKHLTLSNIRQLNQSALKGPTEELHYTEKCIWAKYWLSLTFNSHPSSNTLLRWLTACTQPLGAVFALHHAAAAVLPSVPGWRGLALATAPVGALCPTGWPLCPLRPAAVHWNETAGKWVTGQLITPGRRDVVLYCGMTRM